MVSRIGSPQPGYSAVEKVFIRCPVKGGPVYTGLDMNPADFEKSTFNMSVPHCRCCGGEHPWRKADSWLQHCS